MAPEPHAARAPRIALQGVLPADLAERAGIDLTDARRIVSIVHRHGALPDRSPATVRRAALDRARAIGHVPSLDLAERHASAVDPFVKYSFALDDGRKIESVRIPLEKKGRFSVCVSAQAGCALACAFCATGTMGLGRNLATWEIIEQVRRVRADLAREGLAERVHGVVFQGMGEPLANADRVIEAIRVLSDPSAQAIDMRAITVCTAGVPAGIRRLTREVPAVRLGISIGSVRPDVRKRLMPVERTSPLTDVLDAVGAHAKKSGHAPMFAYTLLAGENDTDADAEALAALAASFAAAHGLRPRVSLIPWNSWSGASFARSPRLDAFRDVLIARGAGAIVRYSGGGDVGAACGQLVC